MSAKVSAARNLKGALVLGFWLAWFGFMFCIFVCFLNLGFRKLLEFKAERIEGRGLMLLLIVWSVFLWRLDYSPSHEIFLDNFCSFLLNFFRLFSIPLWLVTGPPSGTESVNFETFHSVIEKVNNIWWYCWKMQVTIQLQQKQTSTFPRKHDSVLKKGRGKWRELVNRLCHPLQCYSFRKEIQFYSKSKHTVSFIQVIGTDFLRIRGLINASGVLWKTSQTSKSYGISVNMGFKFKCWLLSCTEQSLDYLYRVVRKWKNAK